MARRDSVPPDAVDRILDQWRHEMPAVDATPMAVFGRIHRIFARYQVHITALFAAYGINSAAFDILAALRRGGAPFRQTAGALGESALLTSGGISLRIDRVEKAGLVVRERDEQDRRVVYVSLTEKGLELAERVAAAHFENEARLLAGVSQAERRQLGTLLNRLERSIDAYELAEHVRHTDESLGEAVP